MPEKKNLRHSLSKMQHSIHYNAFQCVRVWRSDLLMVFFPSLCWNWNRYKIIHIIYWIIVIIRSNNTNKKKTNGNKHYGRSINTANKLTARSSKNCENSIKKCVSFYKIGVKRQEKNIHNKLYTTYGIIWCLPSKVYTCCIYTTHTF